MRTPTSLFNFLLESPGYGENVDVPSLCLNSAETGQYLKVAHVLDTISFMTQNP